MINDEFNAMVSYNKSKYTRKEIDTLLIYLKDVTLKLNESGTDLKSLFFEEKFQYSKN